ncbi:hypothetical protein MTR62_08900 [Novosphingobium sp. 1949]|uniref:Uncharacterized protein n=1 Tax=Novosphingobium organovorum TaxID=2930092 RepID=A0ABT0BCQ0_9SPHN|nr:hypothetical protein [Novosphingobium organovorum]MCJ2182807.1 hypothetical protein [Novosphingobium organovorum]
MIRRPALAITVPPPESGARLRIAYAPTGVAARLVHGQIAQAVPATIGRLFAVCTSAQELASWLALCAAQGHAAEPVRLATLRHAASLEALRETALHVLLVWPSLYGEPGGRAAAAAIMAATRGEGDGPAIARTLAEAVFGCDPDEWLARHEGGRCASRWVFARETQAAHLLDRALADREMPIHPAPSADGPLARMAGSSFVADFEPGSLAAHRAARLVELARLAASFARGAPELPETRVSSGAAGEAYAQVACARGTLVHTVRLGDGRIADYGVVSPTDAAFAPTGHGRAWLQTVADGTLDRPRQAREAALRLVLAAIDPCVEHAFVFETEPMEGAL